MTVVSFQGYAVWTQVPNPFNVPPLGQFVVRDDKINLQTPLLITDEGGFTGLNAGHFTQLNLTRPTTRIFCRLSNFAVTTVVEAYDDAMQLIPPPTTLIRKGSIGEIEFRAPAISYLVFKSLGNEANFLIFDFDADDKKRVFFDGGVKKEKLSRDECAEVIYGETSALRAPPPGTEADLASGRDFIAAVAYARYLDDPTRFAPKQHPTDEQLQDGTIRKHWDLCNDSAARGESMNIGNCLHYVVWPINATNDGPTDNPKITDPWPYTEKNKITAKFGPFRSYVAPISTSTYIFKYCGVAFEAGNSGLN